MLCGRKMRERGTGRPLGVAPTRAGGNDGGVWWLLGDFLRGWNCFAIGVVGLYAVWVDNQLGIR